MPSTYAKVSIGGQFERTELVKESLNPAYMEMLEIRFEMFAKGEDGDGEIDPEPVVIAVVQDESATESL